MAKVIEYLPCINIALNSSPVPQRKKNEKKKNSTSGLPGLREKS
jgi:hypothetical protein